MNYIFVHQSSNKVFKRIYVFSHAQDWCYLVFGISLPFLNTVGSKKANQTRTCVIKMYFNIYLLY